MKRRRHTPEEIIHKLRDADADLAAGLEIGAICQKLGVSEAETVKSGNSRVSPVVGLEKGAARCRNRQQVWGRRT